MQTMYNVPRSVTWDAPEHNHVEKSADWFFALAVLAIAAVVAAVLVGNYLFAVLCGVAGIVLAVAAGKPPRIIPFAVTARGIRIGATLFPYTTLASYHIDEDHARGPQLLVLSQRHFMPLLVIPIPEEYIDEIESILQERLAEDYLEESFFQIMLEAVGF